MRKLILTYGIISGTIVAALLFATMPFWKTGVLNFNNGETVGYTTMVIALAPIFFAVKSCRDHVFHGSITFWQAAKVGLLISLIAAVMYALAWEICYRTIATDFIDKMSTYYLEQAKQKATSAAEVQAAIEEMDSFKEWYKNPVLRFAITTTEILPVGIVITAVSALFLRNKDNAVNPVPAHSDNTKN